MSVSIAMIQNEVYMVTNFPPLHDSDYSIDLMFDLGQLCSAELSAMGYTNISSTDPTELCERYLNALYRRVPTQKRSFHQSKQLRIPTEVQEGYDLLKQKVVNGDDLTPHLSGLLDDLDFNDPLLNAWNIHHFHLGTKPHPTKPHLVERTGPILLAMVHDDFFYAISILPHGKGGNHDVFYNQDLIEILHDSFPQMMANFKISGKAATPKPTISEVKQLRDAGITSFAQTNDGTLYMPNLGFTSIGGTTKHTGARIIVDTMRVTNAVKNLEKLICEKLVALELCFSKTGGKRPYKIILTGFLNNGYVTAREETSYVSMRISLEKGSNWLDVWHEMQP